MVEESPQAESSSSAAANIYERWDEAQSTGDLDGMLSLYTDDASLQSPLVPVFFGEDKIKQQGKAEVAAFWAEVFRRRAPAQARLHRSQFISNGTTVFWETPAETPTGQRQLDLAQVMDLEDGLIKHHRIYWGWFGVRILKASFLRDLTERGASNHSQS